MLHKTKLSLSSLFFGCFILMYLFPFSQLFDGLKCMLPSWLSMLTVLACRDICMLICVWVHPCVYLFYGSWWRKRLVLIEGASKVSEPDFQSLGLSDLYLNSERLVYSLIGRRNFRSFRTWLPVPGPEWFIFKSYLLSSAHEFNEMWDVLPVKIQAWNHIIHLSIC